MSLSEKRPCEGGDEQPNKAMRPATDMDTFFARQGCAMVRVVYTPEDGNTRAAIAGEYPPARAHADAQYENRTSRDLARHLDINRVDWIDLFPCSCETTVEDMKPTMKDFISSTVVSHEYGKRSIQSTRLISR